jgi:dihydropteroate synthase
MGVVNVTPDSFAGGGVHFDPRVAIAAAHRMVDEGAAIVDVGGESTRPGSGGISVAEELRRVVPVLEGLAGLPVSIAEDPLASVVLGTGKMLTEFALLRRIAVE